MSIMDDFNEDVLESMINAYEELRLLLTPVMHDKLKYREACKFVADGKLIKCFKNIKVIVEAHQHLTDNLMVYQ